MVDDNPLAAADRLANSFGFQKVEPAAKAKLVRGVFDRVASRYDLMNDLMSGGVHRLWKDAMVDWLMPRPGRHYVDIAGGTGDIALRILDRIDGSAEVTVIDINPAMVAIGRDRAVDRGRLEGIHWVVGDGQSLPLPSRSADALTIAFGIRNVTHVDRLLREAHRVLRPGGRFLCMEFSKIVLPVLERLYDAYSFNVVPLIGRVVAGDADSYRYLVESIRQFPGQDEFAAMIAAAGLERVRYRNLSGGIAAIHSGWRL